jgi:hypothetical protein
MSTGLVGALVKIKSSYDWHRTQAFANIGQNGIVKRDRWLDEVRKIYKTRKVTWREALSIASTNRASDKSDYKTVKNRIVSSYTGRQADTVTCSGPVCPGRYDREASTNYRPQGHKNKRVLTQASAMALLKKYYSKRGNLTNKLIAAQKAMKTDISKKRVRALEPCAVKQVVDRNGVTRNIANKQPECADNWLYRNTNKYDMKGVDNGTGELYNEALTVYRKSRY